MKIANLSEMKGGWFVGDFLPTLLKTQAVEVGVKKYNKGEYAAKHHHKIATEITVLISGSARMNECTYYANDIIVIEPGDSTDFLALEDVITVVVKLPGATNDKYLDV